MIFHKYHKKMVVHPNVSAEITVQFVFYVFHFCILNLPNVFGKMSIHSAFFHNEDTNEHVY